MGQGVTVNHLVQKCARNLKNERPGNKSAKTVIENSSPGAAGPDRVSEFTEWAEFSEFTEFFFFHIDRSFYRDL